MNAETSVAQTTGNLILLRADILQSGKLGGARAIGDTVTYCVNILMMSAKDPLSSLPSFHSSSFFEPPGSYESGRPSFFFPFRQF